MQLGYGDWMSRPLRWSLRQADGLVAISEFVPRTLTSTSGHRPERIHLAYNAVVFERMEPRRGPRRAAGRARAWRPLGPMVVNVSRLFPAKGTAELVRAMALVRKDDPGRASSSSSAGT